MRAIYATTELHVLREAGDTTDVPSLLREWGMFTASQEVVWVVTYDASTALRSVIEVARGSQFRVQVSIADVLQAVLASGSRRFWLMHNHPTAGKLKPTKTDMDLTQQVKLAALVCGFYLEDHIIIGPPEKWYSMLEHKEFKPSSEITELYAAGQPVWVHEEP